MPDVSLFVDDEVLRMDDYFDGHLAYVIMVSLLVREHYCYGSVVNILMALNLVMVQDENGNSSIAVMAILAV